MIHHDTCSIKTPCLPFGMLFIYIFFSLAILLALYLLFMLYEDCSRLFLLSRLRIIMVGKRPLMPTESNLPPRALCPQYESFQLPRSSSWILGPQPEFSMMANTCHQALSLFFFFSFFFCLRVHLTWIHWLNMLSIEDIYTKDIHCDFRF